MCGIVGLIDNATRAIEPARLEAMRDAVYLRGPDGEGHYIERSVGMAMRRLSIIDIEGGRQPFFSRDRQVVAFQNGEIYNFRDLRKQLVGCGQQFTSQSDTEVLAHGFAEWGIETLLDKVDGMYALAILDRSRRELHLARDRFGEKPLFYAAAPGRFAYASSLLVLAALEWVQDDIDPRSLDRYLALHYVPGDSTILKGIRRVLPGERLVVPIDDPTPRRSRYYAPRLRDEKETSDAELAAIIEASVESRLMADVPVGVFLSGGLDSSIVAAIAAKRQPRIDTFSMGFGRVSNDESRYAKLVAGRIGSNHHHFMFDEDSFRTLLPRVAAALDEPVGDQAMLPLYWLCREARRHVTVALSGDGADEVFGGYSYYENHSIPMDWRSRLKARLTGAPSTEGAPRRLIDNPQAVTPSGFPLLTDAATRKRLTGESSLETDEWEQNLITWLDQSRDRLRRATATDIATWLPDDLLVKFDRMSMVHSLEGRAPYLNPRVVECGLKLHQSRKMNGSTSKIALRQAAGRWLPREILARPKQGFVLPMAAWLEQWLRAQVPVKEYLEGRALAALNIAEATLLIEQDLRGGVKNERLLFALVLLVEWHCSFRNRRRELAMKYKNSK